MIYLLLFGLDFYDKLVFVCYVISVLGLTSIVIGFLFYKFNETTYGVRQYLTNPDFEPDSFDYEQIVNYKFGLTLFSYKKKAIIFSLFTALLPSSKTITIATGLYAGEQLVKYAQETPLAKKAYQLAEKKIDELLSEPESSNKEGKAK